MTFDYALKEGFLDLRKRDVPDCPDIHYTLFLQSEEFRAMETMLGLVLIHKQSNEAHLVDTVMVNTYATDSKILNGVSSLTNDELQSL